MPSLIHTSSGFANTKVVLSAQNYTEDDRGLVSASLQYVARASDRSAVDAMFYTDAAPPIWPTYLDRGRLIGRNLYMQSRSLSEQYGLLTIDALYVGGRERIVPLITGEFAAPVNFLYQNTMFNDLVTYIQYTYTPLVTSLSFVKVAGIDSYAPVKPKTEQMYTLVDFDSLAWIDNGTSIVSIKQDKQYFIDLINTIPVLEDRKTESLTPTVQIITVRYSMR